MEVTTGYGIGSTLSNSITLPSNLTTTETDLFVLDYQGSMRFSQFSVFCAINLATNTVASATFYYYFSPDNGTTWIPRCLYNTTTGEMTIRLTVLDSSSYSTGSPAISMFVDDLPVSGATKFKITGKCSSSTAAISVLQVIGRNN